MCVCYVSHGKITLWKKTKKLWYSPNQWAKNWFPLGTYRCLYVPCLWDLKWYIMNGLELHSVLPEKYKTKTNKQNTQPILTGPLIIINYFPASVKENVYAWGGFSEGWCDPDICKHHPFRDNKHLPSAKYIFLVSSCLRKGAQWFVIQGVFIRF